MNDDGHGVVTDSATREIGTSARSVGSLVAKQAERAKLSNISLPSAYRELGQQVFESGNRRDFPDLHDRIDEIVASIDHLNTEADGVEPADTLGAKAKAVLDSGKAAAKRKVLERTRSQAFIELGKAAFEHDDQHGTLASKKIAEVISRLAALDREIEELKRESSEGMKNLRTNPVVIGVLLVCFFPVGLFLVWRHPTWSRNQKLGWTGVLAAVLVMGMVLMAVQRQAALALLKDANDQWAAADQAAAVDLYQQVLENNWESLDSSQRRTALRRTIEFFIDRGNDEGARRWIEMAIDESEVPTFEDERANALLAEVRAEAKPMEAHAQSEVDDSPGGAPFDDSSSGSATSFKVSKGLFKGSVLVEVSSVISDEITLRDFGWDGGNLLFKLTMNEGFFPDSPSTNPWHYSVFDDAETKINGGTVIFPSSIRSGQTVRAEIFVGHDNKKAANRIMIHR